MFSGFGSSLGSGLATRDATPATAGSSGTSLSSFQRLMIEQLGIPSHLANRNDHTLPFAYEKYLGYLKACDTLNELVAAGTWAYKKPNIELVEIFASRSYWHSHYRGSFSSISQHEDMVQWLEGGEGKPDNMEVWGVDKLVYGLGDLLAYIKRGGPLGDDSGKGGSKHKDQRSHKKDKKDKKGKDVEDKKDKGKGKEKEKKKSTGRK